MHRFDSTWPFFEFLKGPNEFKSVESIPDGAFEQGVYFLTRGDQIVYIGQSGDVGTRIKQHRAEGRKQFDGAYFTPVGCHSDRLRVEGILILACAPEYNRACCVGFTADGRAYDYTRTQMSRLASRRKPSKKRRKA